MRTVQSTAVIRERGQLTIPDEIREVLSWATPRAVVSLSTTRAEELILRPYRREAKDIEWRKIWESINLSRSFVGKRGNLSQFIVSDREHH